MLSLFTKLQRRLPISTTHDLELLMLWQMLRLRLKQLPGIGWRHYDPYGTATAAAQALSDEVRGILIDEVDGSATEASEEAAENTLASAEREQVALLRDIFGNPFRPVTLNPVYQTPTAQSLAQSIYDQRTFSQLPILADALEEAGCTDAAILNHCRQPGEHVRGCWVVDLVLGKS